VRAERRLLLVRHGLTEWNREGRFQGHLDPPLSDDGRDQARCVARRLAAAAEPPVRIITSSLERARETAQIIGDALGAPGVETDRRLIEIGQGAWEGRTHAELELDDPERYAAWRRQIGHEQPPGGEPIDHALERVAAVMAEVTDTDDWPICLVAHGGTLRLLTRLVLELGAPHDWDPLELDNASLSTLSWTSLDGWRLESWNDVHHLLGRGPVHVAESDGAPLAL
jgi:broad specificity phosphatase PhoE